MHVGVYTRVCVYMCESGSVCAFEKRSVCERKSVCRHVGGHTSVYMCERGRVYVSERDRACAYVWVKEVV